MKCHTGGEAHVVLVVAEETGVNPVKLSANGNRTSNLVVQSAAERIRKACQFTLLSLAGTIVTCLLLGFGLYWPAAQTTAVVVFVASIFCLMVGTLFYLAEITVALSSVRDEAKFFHLIDLGMRSTGEAGPDVENPDRRARV